MPLAGSQDLTLVWMMSERKLPKQSQRLDMLALMARALVVGVLHSFSFNSSINQTQRLVSRNAALGDEHFALSPGTSAEKSFEGKKFISTKCRLSVMRILSINNGETDSGLP